MIICIRTDASVEIGSGHVMRCLALAEALRDKGAMVSFICRELQGNLIGYIVNKGFFVHHLPAPENKVELSKGTKHACWLGVPWQADAKQIWAILEAPAKPDWLIVDHYAIGHGWEKQLRPLVKRIMVIDDLADRFHDCDVLLDQNLHEQMESRYTGLLPEKCVTLLGPRHALLRPEFSAAHNGQRTRDGNLRRILLFFGGSDVTNETSKALNALRFLSRDDITADVVVGQGNFHKDGIRQTCRKMPNTTFHCQVTTMASLMACADLSLGAGGTTTWERCAVGLPTVTIAVADNQIPIVESAAKRGVLAYLGTSSDVTAEEIAAAIRHMLDNPAVLREMSEKAAQLVDGKGATRVAAYLV